MSDLFMDMHHGRLNRTATAAAAAEEVNDSADDDDTVANILSLKLKKPKHWKWELTTSRSCSNIALPRILLYNHHGDLLADADSQEEQVLKQPDHDARGNHKAQRAAASRKRLSSRAATSNLAHSIRQALDREFNGLQIQEATPSPEPHVRRRRSAANTSTTTPTSTSCIDYNTHELPDYKFDRRSSSMKGVRFQVDHDSDTKVSGTSSFHLADLPTPPSTTTTTTTATMPSITATPTTTSSSSGPREKRRYRRSQSTLGGAARSPAHSESILERFSYNRGRFSSPEFECPVADEVPHAPRYFLCTSKAGTLVVQQESFSRCRRRRKPKHSSSENIQHELSSKSHSTSSLKMTDSALLAAKHLRVPDAAPQQVATLPRTRKKALQPLRRYRSDGNVLLHEHLSTSEEEQLAKTTPSDEQKAEARHHRRYSNFARQSKKDLVTIDPGNAVQHTLGSPTAR